MDLIYADEKRIDIGVLKDYTLDMAYGSDENDFELLIDLDNNCCSEGYFIFMEDSINGKVERTEYGGIIDAIQVDTDANTVTYSGRTWQGILSGKIIAPPNGYDYYTVTGEANMVIAEIITYMNLGDIFQASTDNSGIDVAQYQFRYKDVYQGLCDMLSEFGAKLMLRYEVNHVVLYAEWAADYSQDDEWDSSQTSFVLKKQYRTVNHLICLGQGDLKNRSVIHLFTDENGGIQPYAKTDNPLENSDYILDCSKQIMTGANEIAEIYDYPNAGITENYKLLTTQPIDWSTNYASYYKHNSDNSYTALEVTEMEKYTLLTTQPTDWTTNYANYYVKNGSNYKTVEGTATTTYRKQTSKPIDWANNYSTYYYYYSDGVDSEYKSVSGTQKTRYNIQTQKPTDWATNYSQYFKKNKKGKYIAVDGVTKGKKTIAPTWKAKTYYTSENYNVAPKWTTIYFTKNETTVAPNWSNSQYYSLEKTVVKPSFTPGTIYKKVYDYYAVMVESGIEKLQEAALECDSISIDLELTGEYDIGDIVGATEVKTGIAVWQPITKKIVKIVNNVKEITYEIGKEY